MKTVTQYACPTNPQKKTLSSVDCSHMPFRLCMTPTALAVGASRFVWTFCNNKNAIEVSILHYRFGLNIFYFNKVWIHSILRNTILIRIRGKL